MFQSDGSEEDQLGSQSSQYSLTRDLNATKVSSTSPAKKRDAFDFDEDAMKTEESPPMMKKTRVDGQSAFVSVSITFTGGTVNVNIFLVSESDERKVDHSSKSRPVYRHKWNAAEGDEEEEEVAKKNIQPPVSLSLIKTAPPCHSASDSLV